MARPVVIIWQISLTLVAMVTLKTTVQPVHVITATTNMVMNFTKQELVGISAIDGVTLVSFVPIASLMSLLSCSLYSCSERPSDKKKTPMYDIDFLFFLHKKHCTLYIFHDCK